MIKCRHSMILGLILGGCFAVTAHAQNLDDIFNLYDQDNTGSSTTKFSMDSYSTISSQCTNNSYHNEFVCPGIDLLRTTFEANIPPSTPPKVAELVDIQSFQDTGAGTVTSDDTSIGGNQGDSDLDFSGFGPQ